MEFISLDEALEGIAACVRVHEFAEYPSEEKISGSAGLLHQILNNAQAERPHWAEINSITKRPVFNDAAIYPEGMAILVHTAGWYEREWQNHVKHMFALSVCKDKGIDQSLVLKGQDINAGQYPRLKFLRPREIGFDRTKLIAFLDSNQIAHSLEPQAATNNFKSTVVSSVSDVPQSATKAKRSLWFELTSSYIVDVMRAGQFATVKELYRVLQAKAGEESPFDKGEGLHRDKLFVREILQPLALKTIQNKWPQLQEMAQKKML